MEEEGEEEGKGAGLLFRGSIGLSIYRPIWEELNLVGIKSTIPVI